jgi:hypothetical protein
MSKMRAMLSLTELKGRQLRRAIFDGNPKR